MQRSENLEAELKKLIVSALVLEDIAPEEIETAAAEQRIYQVAYHRDYKEWELAYSPACEVRGEFNGLTRATVDKDFANFLFTQAWGGQRSPFRELYRAAIIPPRFIRHCREAADDFADDELDVDVTHGFSWDGAVLRPTTSHIFQSRSTARASRQFSVSLACTCRRC